MSRQFTIVLIWFPMVSLDSRSIRIINALLANKTARSTAEIAASLDISPRMVRYRLDRISAWLSDHGVTLQKKYGVGLWIEGDQKAFAALEEHLKEISGYELILSPLQRQQILLFTLLQEEQPVIAKKLEVSLGVSRSTLFSDLDMAVEWLDSHSLSLIRKPGYGIRLNGREEDKRQALVDLIIEHLEPDKLMYALFGGRQNISPSNPAFVSIVSSPILIFLNSLQASLSYQIIINIEEKIHVQFSDFSTPMLILHLCIMIVRIAQGYNVLETPDDIDQLTQHSYFSTVLDELTELGRNLNIPISLEEISHIFSVMLRMEMYPSSQEDLDNNLEDLRILDLIIDSLIEVDDLIGSPRLSENSQVVHELVLIFEPFIDRIQMNAKLQNPLLDEFKSKHADHYHAAEIISDNLSEKTGKKIPIEMIGYIGMCLYSADKKITTFPKTRILIICPWGAITSHLLAVRIRSEFPRLEIVDVMSYRQLLANPIIEADAIISTEEHLPVHTYLPVFHVHPLLNVEDVQKIKAWLLKKDQKPGEGCSSDNSLFSNTMFLS